MFGDPHASRTFPEAGSGSTFPDAGRTFPDAGRIFPDAGRTLLIVNVSVCSYVCSIL